MGFLMVEMRKLKVIVSEDKVDAVVRSLGEAGIVHLVDMREKEDYWKEVLTPNLVSDETIAKCSSILSKIEDSFASLDLVSRDHDKKWPGETPPITKESIEEVLAKVERKLAEISYASIEALAKCTVLNSIIDQLMEVLRVRTEDIQTKEATLQKPVEETLSEVEHELSEIKKTLESLGLLDRQALDFGLEGSPFVERMKALAERKKTTFGAEIAEHRKHHVESEKIFGEKLLKLKKIVTMAREAIEAETSPKEIRKDLAILHLTVDREQQVAKTQEEFVRSAKTIYFEAWVPEGHAKEAGEMINKATDGNYLVSDEPPAPDEKVPILLKPFPSYIAAFAKLVYAFGYPSSGDINPVLVLAITFPILFGIMFADVGQGAILVIFGLILTLLKKRVKLEKVGDIIQYLLISSEMLIFFGVSAIFFGFVFGEFFGPSGVVHPILLGRIGPFDIGGFEPVQEPMKMLKFAIFVGVVHLSLGLILRLSNEVKHRHYKLAPVPVCWLWLLLGGLFMWAYWGGISNISKWFAEGVFMLVGLVVMPLMLIIVFTGLAEGSMEGIGFGVEVFAETLSHAMSYSRLMVLGLIHSAMNSLFLVLGGVEHGHFPPESIPIVAVGTILVMIIEGLVVFVHTLRLHWVEWFSEFHSGEGIVFKPFKLT